jgi:hypothetical protein
MNGPSVLVGFAGFEWDRSITDVAPREWFLESELAVGVQMLPLRCNRPDELLAMQLNNQTILEYLNPSLTGT